MYQATYAVRLVIKFGTRGFSDKNSSNLPFLNNAIIISSSSFHKNNDNDNENISLSDVIQVRVITRNFHIFILSICLISRILVKRMLTLKAPITIAADDIHEYFLIVFQRK